MTGELGREEETPRMHKAKACVRTQQAGMFYKPRREALGESKTAPHLDLGLLASGIMRK